MAARTGGTGPRRRDILKHFHNQAGAPEQAPRNRRIDMTYLLKNLVVAAAAMALAGIASAQTVKADVPFAFNVGTKLMQPGTYLVSVLNSSGHDIYKLTNTEQRESVMAGVFVAHDPAKEWRADGRPRLAFECGESECTLAEFWNGVSGAPSYRFHLPKPRGESFHLAIIVGHMAKTE
jgi:hypothetical protein